jgi:hypothetical protein
MSSQRGISTCPPKRSFVRSLELNQAVGLGNENEWFLLRWRRVNPRMCVSERLGVKIVAKPNP